MALTCSTARSLMPGAGSTTVSHAPRMLGWVLCAWMVFTASIATPAANKTATTTAIAVLAFFLAMPFNVAFTRITFQGLFKPDGGERGQEVAKIDQANSWLHCKSLIMWCIRQDLNLQPSDPK